MNKKILFVSIDGLTDPLGQSQILPYLYGLATKGFEITIVSCEKDINFIKNKEIVAPLLKNAGIKWRYCFYNTKLPLVSQWLNYRKLKKLAETEVKYNSHEIIHCRSYLPALIGLDIKKKYGSKFIFDMRGFWADERIDGGIWKLSNPIHKRLYNYFKRKEQTLIKNADYIVCLAATGKKVVNEWLRNSAKPIEVIPCCADTNYFTILPAEQKKEIRKKNGIADDSVVLGYLGSIGTWYMLNEMLDFFSEFKKKKKNALLFFVTQENPGNIFAQAKKKNIDTNSILVKAAARNEVPQYISTFDLGLFFIKPLFSKQGSSPTKMAEILSCGIPVITNAGVGDCDMVIKETGCGILVNDFTSTEYSNAVEKTDALLQISPEKLRQTSLEKFSLTEGISRYERIYNYLFSETK
ncbi:MAG: glycosyltransferase [Bacteroidia bacterium]